MKILHVIPSFGMGGAERVVLNYLEYGQSADVEMRAVSLYPSSGCENDKEIEERRLPVVYLDKGLGLDLRIVAALKRVIKAYDPDVIHTHLYALKYVLLTGECKHRKMFHTIHSVPWNDATSLDQKVNMFCFKTRRVQAVALQETLAEQVNHFYGIKNTKVIQNGISLERFRMKDEKLRQKLKIPEKAFVVGHIGAFKDAKNHSFLLEVFKAVTEQKDDAYLLLIGDGIYRSRIEEEIVRYGIKDKVLMLGNRRNISELLHIMDVFLFPSVYEGFGLAVVEAQAAGIRCVMSEAVPIETVVTDFAVRLSLEEPVSVWADVVLNNQCKGSKYKELISYDINCVIQKLILLYKNVLER